MKPGETVELELTYEELDTLMQALDYTALHYTALNVIHEGGEWRRLERKFGNILYTDLDTNPDIDYANEEIYDF